MWLWISRGWRALSTDCSCEERKGGRERGRERGREGGREEEREGKEKMKERRIMK